MNPFRPHTNLLFSLIVAFAVVLKPVSVFAGIDLVHPSLLIPKVTSPTMGTPARSLGAYSRLDKMETHTVAGTFLKSQFPKAHLGLGLGLRLKGQWAQIPRPLGFSILRI